MSRFVITGASGGSPNRLEINDLVKNEKFFSLYIQALRRSTSSCHRYFKLLNFGQRLCLHTIRMTSSLTSLLLGSMVFLVSLGTMPQVTPHSTQPRVNGEDTVCMAQSFSQLGIDPILCFSRFLFYIFFQPFSL